MADNQVLAALLTVARCSTQPRPTSKRRAAKQWGDVWQDYNKFRRNSKKRMSVLTCAESIQTEIEAPTGGPNSTTQT